MADDTLKYDPDYDAPCLDLKAACVHIGARPSTMRKRLRNGDGPRAFRLPGSTRWRFARRDLDEWVRGYERGSSEDENVRRSRLRGIAATAARKRALKQTKAEEVNA